MYCYSLSSSGNGLQTKIKNINTRQGIFTEFFNKKFPTIPLSYFYTFPKKYAFELNKKVFPVITNKLPQLDDINIFGLLTKLLCGDFLKQTKTITESTNSIKQNIFLKALQYYSSNILHYMTLSIIYFFSLTFSPRREGCLVWKLIQILRSYLEF